MNSPRTPERPVRLVSTTDGFRTDSARDAFRRQWLASQSRLGAL